ncbi:hypothetical protein BS78_06G059400 [Paspalum vaginatum]|nr:hypothetical protein BS78_06G059400 [Paspalum vaginatum]
MAPPSPRSSSPARLSLPMAPSPPSCSSSLHGAAPPPPLSSTSDHPLPAPPPRATAAAAAAPRCWPVLLLRPSMVGAPSCSPPVSSPHGCPCAMAPSLLPFPFLHSPCAVHAAAPSLRLPSIRWQQQQQGCWPALSSRHRFWFLSPAWAAAH